MDRVGVTLKILNDIEMRNKRAEENLVAIGEMYRRKMWMQTTENDNAVTPRKRTLQQETSEISNTSPLNRTRQPNDKISRCLKFDVQEAETQNVGEEPQFGNNRNTQTGVPQKNMISPDDSCEEEVIYSEGEPYDELYPDNTWDSDNEVQEEGETSLTSGWV